MFLFTHFPWKKISKAFIHPLPNPTPGTLLSQERLAEQKAAEEAVRAEQRQKLKAEKAEQNARKVQEEKEEAELGQPRIGGERLAVWNRWFNLWYINYTIVMLLKTW